MPLFFWFDYVVLFLIDSARARKSNVFDAFCYGLLLLVNFSKILWNVRFDSLTLLEEKNKK